MELVSVTDVKRGNVVEVKYVDDGGVEKNIVVPFLNVVELTESDVFELIRNRELLDSKESVGKSGKGEDVVLERFSNVKFSLSKSGKVEVESNK